MNKTIPACVIALSLFLPQPCFSKEISLNNQSLTVPAPEGYVGLSGHIDWLFDFIKQSYPELKVYEAYTSAEDFKELSLNKIYLPSRGFSFGSSDKLSEATITAASFKNFKESFKKDYQGQKKVAVDLIEKTITSANKAVVGAHKDFNVVIDEALMIGGELEEGEDYIICESMKKYRINEQPLVSVTAAAMVRVKNTIIILNGSAIFNSKSDLIWVKTAVRDWVKQTLDLNPPVLMETDADFEAFMKGQRAKYSSTGHPKSRGLNFSIEYPATWKAAEGERPNILQKFSPEPRDGITKIALIVVKELPKMISALATDESVQEMFTEDQLKEMTPPGAVFIKGGPTKYDGQPGGWSIFSQVQERAGINAKSYIVQNMFYYSGKIVTVQCMVGGLAQEDEKIHATFQRYLPLFQQIGNSIVIQDKWTKSENKSAMEHLFGELWWLGLIVSLALTWGFGLLPPVLIRFAILRRPISKVWALVTVGIFWVFNLVFFILLGSTSKTHTALFLVAWASYSILRKGHKAGKSPSTTFK